MGQYVEVKEATPINGLEFKSILTHLWAGTTHSHSAVVAISGAGAIPITDAA